MQRIFEAGLALQSALLLLSDREAIERIHVALDRLDETLTALRLLAFDVSTDEQLTG